jgi:Protein of unknown function (DUF3224)
VRATGTFDVKMSPLPDGETLQDLKVTRFAGAKNFKGDFEGTSRVEMMAAGTPVQGSGGYVAMERATGSLRGRKGSFTLLHQGTMEHGANFALRVVVVPDSGTDELAGLSGTMEIVIAEGKHSYVLDYALPELPQP